MRRYGFLFFFCVKAFAASSLFHVVIAEKWLEVFETYDEAQRRAFLVGTLFPDIRYIAKLPRKATHEKGLTIQEIRSIENPFVKGMKLHSFVDETRVAYIEKNNILKFLDGIPDDKVLLLKMLEDDILYSWGQKQYCDELCSFLKTIEEEELQFGVSEIVIQDWHQQHIGYFSLGPRRFYAKILAQGKCYGAMPESTIRLSLPVFHAFESNGDMQNYILNILEEFDRIFRENAPITKYGI